MLTLFRLTILALGALAFIWLWQQVEVMLAPLTGGA